MSQRDSILIVAGEASSSAYASRLLELWKKKNLNLDVFGVGSREMESLGFRCIGRSEEMAVVGLFEVLKEWKTIYGAFNGLVEEARIKRPKVAILMDYPDFNLLLAKRLKKLGIQVVYYISPQIWAWRQGRVKTIKKYVDHMLVLFPFEVDFYKKYNVKVDFVGHPLLDDLNPDFDSIDWIKNERAKYGLPTQTDKTVFGLMPGSRRSEIHHHLNVQIEVAKKLKNRHPDLSVALFVAPTLTLEGLKSKLSADIGFPIQLIQRNPYEMIALADVILCASGTATLMVGLLKKPMVIMYIVNPITKVIAEFIIRNIKIFGLSNIILGRLQSKEFKNDEATVENLVEALEPLIADRKIRQEHIEGLAQLRERLGSKGATQRVSEIIEGYLK